MEKSIRTFRIVSTLEAISFLVLLGIAMPLKYVWDMPEMVQMVGMAHGICLYVMGAVYVYTKLNWTPMQLFIVIMCSVLPFGPFYAERKYLPNRTS